MSALDMFAACPPGLEGLLEAEVRERLPACEAIATPGGVTFRGTLMDLYDASLWLRIPSRVVVRAGSFKACNFRQLVREVERIDLGRFLRRGAAVDVEATARKSRLYHSGAIAERVRTALGSPTDTAAAGTAPAGNTSDDAPPRLRLQLRGERDVFTLSVDASGELLHRRGQKQHVTRAPLRETLAAALLRFAGYDGSTPLVDPMCGSGTLLLEGASIALGQAPGLERSFAFENWLCHDAARYAERRALALAQRRDRLPCPVAGFDRDPEAVRIAAANLAHPSAAGIEVGVAELKSLELGPTFEGATIVANPPYGVRLGRAGDLSTTYRALGALARRTAGASIALVTSDDQLASALGLPLTKGPVFPHGGLRVRFYKSKDVGDAAAT